MSEIGSRLLFGSGAGAFVLRMTTWPKLRADNARRIAKHVVAGAKRVYSEPNVSASTAKTTVPMWLCTYTSDAGSHARAIFESQHDATEFAQRHALAITDAAPTPLVWKPADTGDSTTLITRIGTYVVTAY